MISFEVRAITLCSHFHHNEGFLLELDPARSLMYTFSQERTVHASPLTRCRNTLQWRTRKLAWGQPL